MNRLTHLVTTTTASPDQRLTDRTYSLRRRHDARAGLPPHARGAAADAAHALSQSAPMMKAMVRLLKNPGASQLMALLRKLHKLLTELGVGEAIMLPAIVEGSELLLLLERATERTFTLVVIATDPRNGLRHHAVSPAAGPPKIKYRTCLVLAGVPKKAALDDVRSPPPLGRFAQHNPPQCFPGTG